MDLEEIKRGLRAEIKKRENEQYLTFQCNVRQMCKDVLAKLEEQESEIAELKDKCQMHDFFWEGCGFKKLGFKNSIDVRDYCDELKRQNEDLLPKCRKANRELRATRRALWLMTAEWAEGMGLASCNIAIKLSVKERFFYHDEANREKDIKRYRHRQVVFYKYADYCRAKAEKFKEVK